MLQTISLMCYLGIGALIFSKIENWSYADAVYWADYTLLTVGLGTDFPLTNDLSKGLLIPFALGGIIVLGLVVGSVRSLVLERGKITVGRRALEKERVKWVARLKQRRKGKSGEPIDPKETEADLLAEFKIMRGIQERAQTNSNWISFAFSFSAFLILWLGGALVFTYTEKEQNWGYFDSLYFTYVCLLTIGYGDLYPKSNAGKAFFVVWTMVAVPALTILISNMGDTVVDFVQKATLWVGSVTILPESGSQSSLIPPLVRRNKDKEAAMDGGYDATPSPDIQEDIGNDKAQLFQRIAKEIKTLSQHVSHQPPKRYTFDEWLWYLKLLDIDWDGEDRLNWLSEEGPLASTATEAEWLLEKMCARLEDNFEKLECNGGVDDIRRC